MRVSQISNLSETVPRRKLGGRLKNFVHNIGKRRLQRKMEEMDLNMQVINDLYLKGNPEIAAKVIAVNNYVMKSELSAPKISDKKKDCSPYLFGDLSYEYLIGSCENVDAIYNEFGAYGLIAYSQSMLSDEARDKLLSKTNNYKVSESMVLSDKPVKLTFSEYLASNSKGYVNDIYQRFGSYGKELFDNYHLLGFIKMGVDCNFKQTYSTTSRFDYIDLPLMQMYHAMDGLLKVLS